MSVVTQPGPTPRPSIIQSKLVVPTLPDYFADRPRLRDRIAEFLTNKRVVVLTATAGSGKTTALVEALSASARPVAWLTVDRTEVAPGRLVTYLEAALEAAVPAASGVATAALASGVPHTEAAGLLMQSAGDASVVLVLDDLERLGESPEAWAVVDALVRHAPTSAVIVLVSRRTIPSELCALPTPDVAAISGGDVAFTASEAQIALARCGRADVDAAAAVAATGGWVTGVLFEAWKATEHIAGLGEETDPLYGYLASQILGQLSPEDRECLVVTALLDEVSAAGAEALGIDNAAERLRSLRAVHLPATWSADGRTMRCHSYLRDYLLERLERRGDVRELRMALARRFLQQHQYESATEEFLRAGALKEALITAERAVLEVVDRLDFGIAERWLNQLSPVRTVGASPLATAELMLALASDDAARGVAICDELEARGQRESLARVDERSCWLMLWCYLHVARWKDVDDILSWVGPGRARQGMEFVIGGLSDRPGLPQGPEPPDTDGWPLEPVLHVALYCRGRLAVLAEALASGWVGAMERPWRIAALRALGRTEEALELFDEARSSGVAGPTVLTFVAPELLMDAGRVEEAAEAISEGRRLAADAGSHAYQAGVRLMQARYALRIDRDPAAAHAALSQEICVTAAKEFSYVGEVAHAWRGCAFLLEKRDDEALAVLRKAVDGMVAGDRILELPTAAVYLAEAAWRMGHEDEADWATDLALDASSRQGSNHLLLQALSDFPSVIARRLDADPASDSEWHSVARALALQGPDVKIGRAVVELREFGERSILIEREEVKPRIGKSYELLAYLASRHGHRVERDDLLAALFGERRDDSTRAYLRQAIQWLRRTLPADGLVSGDTWTQLAPGLTVAVESERLEARWAEVARLRGDERLEATLRSLEIYDRGEYLPGGKGPWAEERAEMLVRMAADTRYQAALLAFGAARYDLARRLVDQVVADDSIHEGAWRLRMRIAFSVADDSGVLQSYRACESALADLGAAPSPITERLLLRLRR